MWSGFVHSGRDRKLRELDEMLAGGGGVSWERDSLLAERQRSATLSVDLAQREQSLIEAQQALSLLQGEHRQLQVRHSELHAKVATESELRFSNDRFVQAYNSNLSKLWAAVGRPLNDSHPEVGEAAPATNTHPNATGIKPAPHGMACMQVSDELLPAGGLPSRRLSMSPQPSGVSNWNGRESWSVSPAPISLTDAALADISTLQWGRGILRRHRGASVSASGHPGLGATDGGAASRWQNFQFRQGSRRQRLWEE